MGYFRKWIKRDSDHHLLRAELPLRGALFTTEQMKQHGRALAGLHQVGKGGKPGQLLKRLEALLFQHEAIRNHEIDWVGL